ncbi:hypothetical protein EPI10_030382 [Gossypium australe]|uniref:Uncharacterized protein n=1 Tax=Gossypium australe TaxID=47621 RepID=A0A5B6WZN7_9ROSI|nr:hypothetical protein EPI10_030382 [Gossypium australe]
MNVYNKIYSKSITVGQPKTMTTNHQGPSSIPILLKTHATFISKVYHAGITGHSIENYTAFKKLIKRFIKMGIVRFDDPSGPSVAGNLLTSHSDRRVNAIIESRGKRTKTNVAEVKSLLKWVWKKMIDVGLIIQYLEVMLKRMSMAWKEEMFAPQRKDQWKNSTRSTTQW